MLKILTMGGGKYGFGHLGRCIPIYTSALNLGHEAQLVVANGANAALELEIEVIELNWLNDVTLLELSPRDTVIVDVLDISIETLDELDSRVKRLHIIDDINLDKYQRYSRIDWSIKSHVLSSGASKLSSPSLVPLKPSFSGLKKRVTHQTLDVILLTLGGSDVRSLTPKLILFLRKYFPQCELMVLVGPGFTCINEIEVVADERVTILMTPSEREIASAMERCDLAIATGGHTMYELASAGLPVVQIQIIDNQEVSKYWAYYGFSYFAGWYCTDDFYSRLKQGIEFFLNPQQRNKSSVLGQNLIDGFGAKRLVKEVMS
ncbi:hypothetical protein [Vibrio maritimus]|uniref:hypothetical protein n=1 Tax=Vibrio maritimus TaxID=990268 RepID=UPI001F3868D7|nr:hypothetical protein [Vibrio maritimus]